MGLTSNQVSLCSPAPSLLLCQWCLTQRCWLSGSQSPLPRSAVSMSNLWPADHVCPRRAVGSLSLTQNQKLIFWHVFDVVAVLFCFSSSVTLKCLLCRQQCYVAVWECYTGLGASIWRSSAKASPSPYWHEFPKLALLLIFKFSLGCSYRRKTALGNVKKTISLTTGGTKGLNPARAWIQKSEREEATPLSLKPPLRMRCSLILL